MLTAVQLRPDVYWVGGIDWNARSFHDQMVIVVDE